MNVYMSIKFCFCKLPSQETTVTDTKLRSKLMNMNVELSYELIM